MSEADLFSYTPPVNALEIQSHRGMTFQGRRPGDRKGRPILPGQSQILATDDYAYIRLKGNKWTIIDRADFPLVMGKTWGARKKGVQTYVQCGRTYLHRLIMGEPSGMYVDHKDVNGLNNRRHNLRICTQAENNKNLPRPRTNTSGFKGVYFRKDRNTYSAQIRGPEGRIIRLGCFPTAPEAHDAYCVAAVKYHGEFARVE